MNDGYISVLRSISSKTPTPGGGAVAALTLSHSYSLTSMVAKLTLAREKWINGHEISNKLLSICEPGIDESMVMAHNDCDAFDNVMDAYKLSKDSNNPKSNDIKILSRSYDCSISNRISSNGIISFVT
jgi:formiminotetrahydrofolate cyclodeaminase